MGVLVNTFNLATHFSQYRRVKLQQITVNLIRPRPPGWFVHMTTVRARHKRRHINCGAFLTGFRGY
jgi:hypothetical protein